MAKSRFSSLATEEKYRACLDDFQAFLQFQNKSEHTIRAYTFALRQYFELFPVFSQENLHLYKCYLIEHYRPQTINLRIRAMNCYTEFLQLPYHRLSMVKHHRASFLERVISQADYEYFRSCLLRDRRYTCYFAVCVMASTGLRVSELVRLQVDDVRRGCIDLYSKGNRMRRVYLPRNLRVSCLRWLNDVGYTSGDVFRNRFGNRITTTGIRDQLKDRAIRYNLDPSVVYPHSFRHLFAKNFMERSNDIAMLSDILGHDSIETTRIYLQRSSTEQRRMFNDIVNW